MVPSIFACNSILGNKIFSNGELGIDLVGTDGVTLNDLDDADGGANRQQNYPDLALASNTSSGLLIEGTLNTIPSSANIIVEIFASDVCDASGYGEGKVFLTRTFVSTDASGNASFSVTLPATVPTGHFVTSTATLANNTSEFSRCLAITEFRPTLTLRPAGQGQLVLEWPADAVGFQLEFTETISPPAWTPVLTAIETTNGVNRMPAAPTSGMRFYRLKQ